MAHDYAMHRLRRFGGVLAINLLEDVFLSLSQASFVRNIIALFTTALKSKKYTHLRSLRYANIR